MTLETFNASLTQDSPPAELSPILLALWYDAKEDWDSAHDIAQDIEDADGNWLHAYLHRREGDNWNARYWYTKAGMEMPEESLQEEWLRMVKSFL